MSLNLHPMKMQPDDIIELQSMRGRGNRFLIPSIYVNKFTKTKKVMTSKVDCASVDQLHFILRGSNNTACIRWSMGPSRIAVVCNIQFEDKNNRLLYNITNLQVRRKHHVLYGTPDYIQCEMYDLRLPLPIINHIELRERRARRR